ncbi:FHA domain-containing protein [Paenibacillus sp. 481]|uniref:FHA domain-containing protein n=1 Tax=Paenibacillus sp. 481 TaxID=2835869 RepID=UPI001E4D3374|nr:FHA domain-containing protein [Paenibacillus sp. 481]UHA74981.1 FHA domain-containing protein [Paenibacillus sp. 481]
MESFACLYIINGEPYTANERMNLTKDETIIGRAGKDSAPDISFANAYISRQHAVIHYKQNQAYITDLGSKHGTEVGGMMLKPFTPYLLNHSDAIRLSKGMVELHLAYNFVDYTMELAPISVPSSDQLLEPTDDLNNAFFLDAEKGVCSIQGSEITLSQKEWCLLHLLHANLNSFVSLDQIKREVWPERVIDDLPHVGLEEVNSLVYRVRRKAQGALHIKSVRGRGYILELQLQVHA